MIRSIVVAASENNVIGKGNELPWRLPADLRFFKQTTIGKPVLMGRNTWESIGRRPLPGRINMVLSSRTMELPDGVEHYTRADAAFDAHKSVPEICIIGGGAVYKALLPLTDVVYLTRVHTIIEGGAAFFPELQEGEWELTWQEAHEADEKHAYDFTFEKWERKK